MKNLNITIDINDLKALFIASRTTETEISFNQWCKLTEEDYLNYFNSKENPKTYSQWVNGQILSLT